MTLKIDLITRKRLVLVKQLYQQAVTQSAAHQSYVNRILSVIEFDLAVETILKAVVAALNSEKAKEEKDFQGLIQQTDNLLNKEGLNPVPDKVNIQHVHSVRNDAQHRAKYPNEADVNDCRTYVRDFLQKITSGVWSLSFANLSLADAIQHTEVKEHLDAAESSLKNHNYKDAVVEAEMGFRMALELVEAAFVGNLSLSTSAFVVIDNLDNERVDRRAYSAFKRMRNQFLISTLGLNVPGYWRYDEIAFSVVNYSRSIATGDTEIIITEEDVSAEDAEFAVAYAVNGVLQIESVVGELGKPFGMTW